jgi:hypothetical protein
MAGAAANSQRASPSVFRKKTVYFQSALDYDSNRFERFIESSAEFMSGTVFRGFAPVAHRPQGAVKNSGSSDLGNKVVAQRRGVSDLSAQLLRREW